MPTSKPNLNRVWAEGAPASNVIDPDSTTPGKFEAGWLAEVPPFEHFNFLQQLFTQGLAYNNEQGVNEWDSSSVYPVNGLVKASDGKLYGAVLEQNGNDPVLDDGTNWINGSNFLPLLINDLSRSSIQLYLENKEAVDYTGLIALSSLMGTEIADGDTCFVTNPGIAGEGIFRNVVAHGHTSTIGVIVTINDDWYWERTYSGPVYINWFVTVSQSSPGGSDVTSIVQYIVDNFDNVTGMGVFELAGTVTQPPNHILTSPGGGVPGYGLIDAQGILGTNYGLTFMRTTGGATSPLWIVNDSCTFIAGVRSLVTPGDGGHQSGILKIGTGSQAIRKTRVKAEVLGAAYSAASGNTVKTIGTGDEIVGVFFDTGAGANTIYECDFDLSLKTLDVGMYLDEQVNANTFKIMSKDCGRHYFLEGGASECLENLIQFNATQGITFSTGTPTVITMRNLCRYNQFWGISEIFGQAFDIIGLSASEGYNQFVGHFNEITFSEVGSSNSFTTANIREFFGTSLFKDTITTSPTVHRVSVQAFPTTAGGFNSQTQIVDETAQAANVGGGIAFGGYFTPTDLANWAEIRGQKENSTSSNFGGHLVLGARPAGGNLTDIAQINNNGNIVMLQDGGGITMTSPDGLTTRTISIDNTGNLIVT